MFTSHYLLSIFNIVR